MPQPAERYVSPLTEFSPDDCVELTRFDNAMAGKYYPVDDDLYARLFNFGAQVAGHRDALGRIISSCAFYPEPLTDPDFHPLQRKMPEWTAFADGAAVDPRYRHILPDGRRLYQEHIQWRKGRSETLGKLVMLSTVRDDNMPSGRSMLANGYYGIAHTPDFAPKNPTWRKVMALPLEIPNLFGKWPTAAKARVALGVRHNLGTPFLSQSVATLLPADFVEYACLDARGANPQDPKRLCVSYFGRIASFPSLDDEVKELLASIKAEIQPLCENSS